MSTCPLTKNADFNALKVSENILRIQLRLRLKMVNVFLDARTFLYLRLKQQIG